MVALDWLRIFRNLGNLNKIREWLLSVIGLRDPKDDSPRRTYDFGEEVTAWRVKLRRESYLMPTDKRPLCSIDRKELDPQLVDFEQTLMSNRYNLLVDKMVKGKERRDIMIRPLYVTKEERSNAEDLSNLSKAALLIRIADKIVLISTDVLKDDFKDKLHCFKRRVDATKKETLVSFCEEVEYELEQQLVLESACHIEKVSVSEG
ncbi:predicted protein [Nematostella vectensis]|uniref:Uncharacterized protein n=1 Tax=Nematostella vectensis TaxID=45351 RepID=A7RQP9_NEMVE|nr:predicted protein [Nematostella vectensis]|eukprot:XP_001638265.1 predicted protein [Nematostella vectensis]